jgi:lipid A 4'-phosphatase
MPLSPQQQALSLSAMAVVVFVIFGIWPGLDLWVSGLFFASKTGFDGFASGSWNQLRLMIWRVSELVLALSILAYLIQLIAPFPLLRAMRRLTGFTAALYLLGPGLLVDVLLKPVWGRARPAQVTEFGGTLAFSPPHVPSHECSSNCSFVAGEMAGAVALAVVLFLVLDRLKSRISLSHQRIAQGLILLVPLFVGVQRIAAGRHFLSDVLLSTIFVLLCAVLLKTLILQPRSR